MRRSICISLVFLVTSVCSIEKMPEESVSLPSIVPAPQTNEETPANNSPLSARGLFTSGGSAGYDSERMERPPAGFAPAADWCKPGYLKATGLMGRTSSR
jgi:hypothetical protein